MAEQVPAESIERRIVMIRGMRVILDGDLAELYGVETRTLNQAVRRNVKRFPADFMIQLTREEKDRLIAEWARLASLRFSPYLPLAYTEYGAIMAANALYSQRAIDMSISLVRAFVQLKVMVAPHAEMLRQLQDLEDKLGEKDAGLRALVEATRQLMVWPPMPPETGSNAAPDRKAD